jgi:hypothetical protein
MESMIADKAEAEEKERRWIAPFGYIKKKEDFGARFPKTDYTVERNCEWLEGAWAAYRAKVAFIQEAYEGQKTRERLYAHIYPNSRHDGFDCYWIDSHNGVESLLNETQKTYNRNRKREKHGFDSDASMAFDDSPAGIAAYLAAPPEFHTRKAEAFFLRYAIDATARLIEHQLADAKSMIAIQIGFVLFCVVVQAAVTGGLTAAGIAWQAPWWLDWIGVAVTAWFLFWGLYCIVAALIARPKGRRIFATAKGAARRYQAVKEELYALSFDPETILNRLKAIEASTGTQLPSYVYTLLKRLDGAA